MRSSRIRSATVLVAVSLFGAPIVTSCDYFAYDVLHSRNDSDGGSFSVEECPEGLAECDGITSTVCETHLQTDPSNCGVCGRSCEGGACQDGVCAPVVLSSEPESAPSGLVASKDIILWAAKGGEKLRTYDPKTQTISTFLTLDTPSSAPTATVKLEADDTHLYWVNQEEGVLRRTSRDVASAEVLVGADVVDIALTGDEFFWLTTDGHILHQAKSGGSANEITSGLTGAADLVADETAIYWRDAQGIGRWRLQEQDISRTARTADTGQEVTSLCLAFYNAPSYFFGTARYNDTELRLTGQATDSFDMFSGGQFWGGNVPFARNVVGALSTRHELGVTPSDLFWVSAASRTDKVGNVGGFMANQPLQMTAGLRASELVIDGKYLYLSNIESGFMSRMVR